MRPISILGPGRRRFAVPAGAPGSARGAAWFSLRAYRRQIEAMFLSQIFLKFERFENLFDIFAAAGQNSGARF